MSAALRPVDEEFVANDSPQPVTYPPLPYDVEVEQALLGMLIGENRYIAEVAPVVSPDDYYDPLHQRIARAVTELEAEHLSVTPLTLKARLDPDRGLAEVGGLTYLANIALAAPSGGNVTQLARIIADLKTRRDAMIAIWDAQEKLSRQEFPVAETLAPVIAIADRSAERAEAKDGPTQAKATAVALVHALESGASEIIGEPVLTGLDKLDDVLGGLYPANLVIAGGRPGMGKSRLAANFARAAAERHVHVEYFSLEMTKAEVVASLIADMDFDRYDRMTENPLSYSRLLRRRCGAKEIERARYISELLEALDIEIHDRSMSMAEISALARAKASRTQGRGIVLIDHLQIVKVSDRYRGSRVGELTEVTGAAKALAKTLNWPVVVLSQLNREVEKRTGKDKRPTLADLRESGSIEQDADVVMFLYRPAYYIRKPPLGPADPEWDKYLTEFSPVEHDLDIDIAKNRNGRTDSLRCYVEIKAGAIRDREPGLLGGRATES